jgi:putative membrane protein
MNRDTALVRGLLGGAAGTGCMTVLRMAARRAGLIDLTPPQMTKHRLFEVTGLGPHAPVGNHVMDALIHLAVGAAGGAVYGAVVEGGRRTSLPVGALFGLGVWAVGFGLLAPKLGISRSPQRMGWKENAVNIAAHLVYGTATALVTGELAQQAHGAGASFRRLRARVG